MINMGFLRKMNNITLNLMRSYYENKRTLQPEKFPSIF